jgi:exopolysaccharide biosynthesis polyprenyl glycosylphosphotransferase
VTARNRPSPESLPAIEAGDRERNTRLSHVASPGVRLRVSERKLMLAVVDFALLATALAVTMRWRTTLLDAPGALVSYWFWFVTLAIVWWLMAQLLECYDLARAASAPYSILSATGAAGLTVLVYQFIPVFTPPLTSRGPILVFALLALSGIALWRGAYAVLFSQPSFQQQALVLGAGWAGKSFAEALQAESRGVSGEAPRTGNPFRGTGYQILGFVDDDPAKREEGRWAGAPVLGGSAELPQLAKRLGVDEVVLAITHRHTMSDDAFKALMTCRELGIPVTTMAAAYERLLGRVPVEHIGHDLAAVLPLEGGATERLYALCKRGLDVVFGLAGVVVLAVLLPVVALANVLYAPGRLFYRQERAGRGGRPFSVLKFRTMRPDAENGTGAIWSPKGDPRITPVGRWLRKSRLDELPQVINVVRGEMSLIGPRPERPEFIEELAASIPYYRARHAVKPGLTGWAQVRYGYGNSVEDARVKLEYDLYYVRHAGLYLDALIILKTTAVVLRLQGK